MTATASSHERVVVFGLDGQRYALPLAAVERVVRAVEVVQLPAAPTLVLGLVDVGGAVLPVISLRRRFSLPERDIALSDQFIVARTAQRRVALVVDEAHGMIEYDAANVAPASVSPGMAHLEGVLALDDGLVLIQDLTKLLSLEEARALDAAMDERARGQHA